MSEIPKKELIVQGNFTNDLRTAFQTVVNGIEAFRKRFKEIAEIIGPALVNLHDNLQKLPDRTKAIQRIEDTNRRTTLIQRLREQTTDQKVDWHETCISSLV